MEGAQLLLGSLFFSPGLAEAWNCLRMRNRHALRYKATCSVSVMISRHHLYFNRISLLSAAFNSHAHLPTLSQMIYVDFTYREAPKIKKSMRIRKLCKIFSLKKSKDNFSTDLLEVTPTKLLSSLTLTASFLVAL